MRLAVRLKAARDSSKPEVPDDKTCIPMSGASTRELMGRMGHVSMYAALVYQRRPADRDRAFADSMDAMLQALTPDEEGPTDDAERARGRHAR